MKSGIGDMGSNGRDDSENSVKRKLRQPRFKLDPSLVKSSRFKIGKDCLPRQRLV